MAGLEVVQPSTVQLVVDGKQLQLQAGPTSLLEALRQKGVKSIKHACGEGGCGACAVLITEVDANGEMSTRSINSCLTPMYAADGCTITTADGLPRNAQGINPVAERMAGFYASQCGFCTPGMAVACHATLAKAASQGRQATAAELRDGLDGNLCRCTGYRPIVDACKSFACDVDIEDLGYNAFTSQGQALPEPASLPPAQAAAPAGAHPRPEMRVLYLAETKQTVYVPTSIEQLKKVASQHPSVRLVAGNTGTGIYKDWPMTEPVLVNIQQVQELQGIHVITQQGSPCVHVGAAVTLAQVIDQLTTWVRDSDKQQQQLQAVKPSADTVVLGAAPVWSEVASHLKRVAGNHVRAAGTMVGNLVLTRNKGLPSDVATLMMAAGATLQVMDLSQADAASQSLSLSDYLSNKDAAASQLVTGTFIPVPQAGSRFWSSRVASRYVNAASVINAAALLPAGGGQPSFVMGMNLEHTHGPEKWRVAHCTAVESALAGVTSHHNTLTPALATSLLAALSKDLSSLFELPTSDQSAPGQSSAQQQHYAYLRSTAEGLLLQAVTALLGDQKQGSAAEPHSVLESHHVLAGNGRESSPDSRTDGDGHTTNGNGHSASQVKPDCCGAVKLPPPSVIQGKQDLLTPDAGLAPLTYSYPKETAKLQAKGGAQYSDDVPLADGALFGAFVLSRIAKGTVRSVDTTAALAAPGAVKFVGVEDVPAPPPPMGEPVFNKDIEYYGQRIGLMLGTSYQAALHAASLVRVEYDEQQPLLDPFEAVKKESVYPLPMFLPGSEAGSLPGSIRMGSADAAAQVEAAPYKLKGVRWHLPSQSHMYMEPQTSVAEMDEDDCIRIHCSSQNYDHTQQAVAQQLGLPQSKVEIRTRRLGGAFGGKMDHASHIACAAAVAALRTGKQVRLAVQRNQDMSEFGGRCEVDVEYDVGFDASGKLIALDIKGIVTGGAYIGFSQFDVDGWCHSADSVYEVPHMQMLISMARLNLPTRTSVRAPGFVTGILLMDAVMDAVAAHLDIDPTVVRERNIRPTPPPDTAFQSSIGRDLCKPHLYTMPRIWKELKASTDYEARQQAVQEFNASHTWCKRGMAMVPCMFNLIAFKKNAIVHIYLDGSVRIAHGGVDMGQGMAIKVMQTASYELSKLLPPSQRPIPLDVFRPADPSSYTMPHNGITGGSATSDGACAAVRAACIELVSRIQPFTKDLGEDYTWQELINKLVFIPGGFRPLVDLTASASAILDERDLPLVGNSYICYGAALTEVEIDVLTGDRRLKSVDILMDTGKSLNPGVDMGQVEGAFIFGAGFVMNEEVCQDSQTGAVTTNSTWHYKVPSVTCVPEKFNITFLKDSPSPYEGPLGAKAVGEPPLLLSSSVASALTAAARAAARQVYGLTPPATQSLKLPALPQHIKHMCGTVPLQKVLETVQG